MPFDPATGFFFEFRRDEAGNEYRDFSRDADGEPQVDDRFEEDPVTGELVQVRERPSGARYTPGDWDDESPWKWRQ